MLDLHAKIRLSVAAVLVVAVSWYLPEALVAPPAESHPRAVGLLTPPEAADPEAQDDESCPPGTATVEQCAALNRAAQAARAAQSRARSPSSGSQSPSSSQASQAPVMASAAAPAVSQSASNSAPATPSSASRAANNSSAKPAQVPAQVPAPVSDAGVLRMARAEAAPLPPGPNVVPSPDVASVHPDTDEGVKAVPIPGQDAEALRSPAPEGAPANARASQNAPQSARPAPPAGAVPAAPPPRPAPAAPPAPRAVRVPLSAEQAEHYWSVQVGVFTARGTAQHRADELTASGFAAYVAQVKMGRHKVVYRVRSPAPDRDSALDLALRLRLAGYDVSLARPQ